MHTPNLVRLLSWPALPLDPADGSGARGIATIEVRAGDPQRTLLLLDLEGLEPGDGEHLIDVYPLSGDPVAIGEIPRVAAGATPETEVAQTLDPACSVATGR